MPKFSSFNIAEGADPMGIGVPYYGESSFDPVEFVRRQWDQTRAKQAAQAETRAGQQKQFQEFLGNIPTVESWEKATAESLNQKMFDLQKNMLDSYEKGEFDPYARDEEGHLKWDKKMKNLKSEMDIYGAMGDKYKAQWSALQRADPEDIDQELTQQRFTAMLEEPTMEGKAQMLQEPLVVQRPKPVEVLDELAKGFNLFIPDRDVDISRENFDPATGLLRTETTEKIDPKKLERAMGQIWDSLSDRVKNEYHRRYEQSPEWQKTATEDGEPVDKLNVKEWFKAQFSPEFAQKRGVSYRARPKEEKQFSWGRILPQRKADGSFDLSGFREHVSVGQGGTTIRANSEASIPLQEIFDKPFMIPTTVNTVDNTTGEIADQGKNVPVLPTAVRVLPVAKQDFEFTDDQDTLHNMSAGDVIPAELQRQMDTKGLSGNYIYDSFLVSRADYQRERIVIEMEGIPLSQRISSFAENHRIPLREAKRYLESAARGRDVDISELFSTISGIVNELNSFSGIFGDAKTEEEMYQKMF